MILTLLAKYYGPKDRCSPNFRLLGGILRPKGPHSVSFSVENRGESAQRAEFWPEFWPNFGQKFFKIENFENRFEIFWANAQKRESTYGACNFALIFKRRSA